MARLAVLYPALVLSVLGATCWQSTAQNGLAARYYRGTVGGEEPVLRVVEPQITSRRIAVRRDQLFGDGPFSATFDGFVSVDRAGEYEFILETDGLAGLSIEGEHVGIDRLGNLPSRLQATVTLHAGLHAVHVWYVKRAGDAVLDLRWRETRTSEAPRPIAPYRLFASRAAFHLRWLLPLFLSGLVLLAPALWLTRHVTRHLRAHPCDHGANCAVVVLLAGSTAMALAGIWWGLPNHHSWSFDEIVPANVIISLRDGVEQGWLLRYPPFHYYVLSIVVLPFEIVGRFGAADAAAAYSYASAFFLMRVVSVLMAAGAVYGTYLCAVELYHDRVAGLWGAGLVATMPVFVYHAKTANLDVPYVFWFVLSLLFYVRYVRHGRLGSVVAFAAAGMLAVCTKDQAYGFYVLPAVHILWLRCRVSRGRMILCDRPLALAAMTALAVLVVGQGVLFTPKLALDHFRHIVGPASDSYAVYEASVDGYLRMFVGTIRQLGWMLTWPGLLICLLGIGAAVRRESEKLWLLLPAVSYYLFFILVVRYQYDRFFLAVCVVLALFGGRLLSRIGAQGPRIGISLAGFVLASYLVAHGSAVNAAMILDGRYRVEAWIEENVGRDSVVAMVGFREDLPRAGDVTAVWVEEDWPQIASLRPDYIVIDTSGRCFPRGRQLDEDIRDDGRYVRVFAGSRSPFPLARMAPDIYSEPCKSPTSNLSRINPPVEVYWRFGRVGEG